MPEITYRAATLDDEALAYRIMKAAMQTYVERTWGKWDEDEQLARHRASYSPATHRLILVDGAVSGLLAVEHEPDCLLLAKLYVQPEYRGRGIGTCVLHGVLHEAAAVGRRVRLRVLRVNTRAQAFYVRHGFRTVEETPERLFMETPNIAAERVVRRT